MKKTYVKPTVEIHFIEQSMFLCMSSNLSEYGIDGDAGAIINENNINDAGDF